MTNSNLPSLPGAAVTLRPAVPEELLGLAVALAADAEVSPWFGTDPDVIARWLTANDVFAFAIELNGEPVGVITFEEETDPDYRAASMDIGLLGHAVGRGAGPDALVTLARHLFDERGHHRITIDPAAANARAIHVYAKVGFRPVGIMRQYERGPDGTWHDSLLMDMLREELNLSAASPSRV